MNGVQTPYGDCHDHQDICLYYLKITELGRPKNVQTELATKVRILYLILVQTVTFPLNLKVNAPEDIRQHSISLSRAMYGIP